MTVSQAEYDKLLREYRNAVAALERVEREIDQQAKRSEDLWTQLPTAKDIIKAIYDAMLNADETMVSDPRLAEVFPWTTTDVGNVYHSLDDALRGVAAVTVGSVDTDELRDEFEDDKRIQQLCDEVDRLRASKEKK